MHIWNKLHLNGLTEFLITVEDTYNMVSANKFAMVICKQLFNVRISVHICTVKNIVQEVYQCLEALFRNSSIISDFYFILGNFLNFPKRLNNTLPISQKRKR